MNPGDIILVGDVARDEGELGDPALVLQVVPPFQELVVCRLSPEARSEIPEPDMLIAREDADFTATGLPAEFLIRWKFLRTIPLVQAQRRTGRISPSRLDAIRGRLGDFFQAPAPPPRRTIGILPARYASTRFPGKPLALIAGQPLIQRVVEQCRRARSLVEVIVATDDARIRAVAEKFCRVEMTRADHPSGSDRIAEVAARCECDAVVNIQGDEPLIDPAVIDTVAGALATAEMSTAATPLRTAAEYEDPNVVKVVVSAAGRALYFSRRTIPYLRDAANRPVAEQLAAFAFLKHLGIYGYRRGTLLRLVQWPVAPVEQAERLEQLRALEHGIVIAVARVDHDSVGVDVPEDVARVEARLRAR